MNRRPAALLWTVAITLVFGYAVGWSGSHDVRSTPSPRTFVPPASCAADAPCASGYWVFLPSDCKYGYLSHPPGSVVLLESDVKLQCRCRLTWLLTKRNEPPNAKVSCAWVDLGGAAEGD